VNEDKATRYQRRRRRAGVLSLLCQATLLAGLLILDGSHQLRRIAESLIVAARLPLFLQPAGTVALSAFGLGVLMEAMGWPFVFYRTYQLERRYRLTDEPVGAWFTGQVKSGALALLLWIVGAVSAYAAMLIWPQAWWVVAGVGVAVVFVAVTNLAAVVFLPLFCRVTPLHRQPLRARLEMLARRLGVPVVDIHEWRLGDRTRRANAVLLGVGPTRRVLLSDTLLAEYSDDEIEVIFAHELAHHVHGDIWTTVVYQGALAILSFWVAAQVLGRLTAAGFLREPADAAGLPALVLCVGSVAITLAPLANAMSRRVERRADRYALDATGNRGAFIATLRRLAAQNLAEERPSRLTELFFSSHPSFARRISTATQQDER